MSSEIATSGNSCCHVTGPGYATPLDAYLHGPREKLLYVPAVVPDHSRPDYLVTIDADPESATYSQVIHRLPMPSPGDELHHSGWNACSSCFGDPTRSRSLLLLPTLKSGKIHAVDVITDPRAPHLSKSVSQEEIRSVTGLSFLHTTHCLANGDVMVSAMGDEKGAARGAFILLDGQLKVKGTWSTEETQYGYDFWYQPQLNVMVSSGWGAPEAFSKGFDPSQVPTKYGNSLYFWNWQERKMIQEAPLGAEGLVPLEVRFLHNPSAPHGYVGAALSSNVIHFTKAPGSEQWSTSVAVKQPWAKVEGWVLPEMPPLITDILISLDDKFLYFSNWLRGDVVQYDISNPAEPRLAGRAWLGGALQRSSGVQVLGGLPDGLTEVPEVPEVKGKKLEGGPQMIQLSLDGKRLYVTNSLYSPWDHQFYPGLVKNGSYLLQLDVDTEHGGLKLNPDFFIDFGAEPDGPVLAHEVRYPGGDCSSDIWV